MSGPKISTDIDTWVNQRTGEAVQAITTVSGATDKGFDKVWLGMILSVLELFGSKRIDVVKYILENRNRSDNTVVFTQKELAKKSKTSYQTVNHTIKILKEANFLTQIVPGYYRINPAVIWRGSHFNRMAIMAKFSEEKREEKAARASEPPNTEQATLPGVSVPPRASQEPLAASERVESPFYEDDSRILGPAEVAEYNSHL